MRLLHNLASLNIFNNQTKILQKQTTALSRISSGLRVSSVKDDPNALSQSERLRMQLRGAQMASKNSQDGVSMMQTVGGALESIAGALQRVRQLTVQAGSDTTNSLDKATIQTEIDQMLKDINDTAKNSEFNGVKLLSGNTSGATISMTTGANVGDKIDIPTINLALYNPDGSQDTSSDISSLTNVDVTTNSTSNNLSAIDNALNQVLSVSSKYGALQNRFESNSNNLDALSEKMQSADSGYRDADISQEMLEYSKDNILVEAGTALMAQTNKMPQDILMILQNMK
jgi:flagellin